MFCSLITPRPIVLVARGDAEIPQRPVHVAASDDDLFCWLGAEEARDDVLRVHHGDGFVGGAEGEDEVVGCGDGAIKRLDKRCPVVLHVGAPHVLAHEDVRDGVQGALLADGGDLRGGVVGHGEK